MVREPVEEGGDVGDGRVVRRRGRQQPLARRGERPGDVARLAGREAPRRGVRERAERVDGLLVGTALGAGVAIVTERLITERLQPDHAGVVFVNRA